jgi:hypothetical protein
LAGGSTSVIPERTEFEWTYYPEDFFEVPFRCGNAECDLLVEGGKAVATLRVAQFPADPQVEDGACKLFESACRVRHLQVRQTYRIQGPTLYIYVAGARCCVLRPGPAVLRLVGGTPDVTLRDAAGNVVVDEKAKRLAEERAQREAREKAERIARDTLELDVLASKLAHSPLLESMVASYERSIEDPGNEFLYLYEVRDALKKHYGGEKKACQTLNIAPEWKWLGKLANREPLEQGRHRGEHAPGLRSATDTELQEARQIIRRWIVAVGRVV